MDRLFGSYQCQLCLRKPSHGWVYICRQDTRPSPPAALPSAVAPTSHVSSDPSNPSPSELISLGFSNSEIKAVENAVYTVEQLVRIGKQKQHLKSVIESELGKTADSPTSATSPENTPPSITHSPQDASSSDVNHRKDSVQQESMPGAHKILGKFKRRLRQESKTCTFLCCHSCRPYYRDRIYTSVNSVFAEGVEPLQPSDTAELRVLDATVLRSIGIPTPYELRPVESSLDLASMASQSTWATHQSDVEFKEHARKSARRFYSLRTSSSADPPDAERPTPPGLRRTVKQAFQSFNVFKGSRESSSAGSNLTLPPSDSQDFRVCDKDAEEVDLGLLHRHSRGPSRLSGTCPDVTPSARHSRRGSVASESSEGSEVEVEGGVALTEEAVEMNMPDIMTQA
ncbi:hypothetical protein W97_08839 [Coniosporium apollinis CBS 100218]|uniref:Uncharacterized protein n=1 Tax=Coniosporium apollinis (strain CBS 100218) TaxID=1168221 RepID=R7Z6F3_CONA1|nr:uncharacterized protein W97_08839 [Coniosporium apollinis CBS 100218]EON69579.1 hypothetical protein W97_08839 [Coniosporium apollinis CBS 100218]